MGRTVQKSVGKAVWQVNVIMPVVNVTVQTGGWYREHVTLKCQVSGQFPMRIIDPAKQKHKCC